MIKWDQLNTITERFFAFYFFNEKNGTRGGVVVLLMINCRRLHLDGGFLFYKMRHPSFGIAM